jgi:hypothetical protein
MSGGPRHGREADDSGRGYWGSPRTSPGRGDASKRAPLSLENLASAYPNVAWDESLAAASPEMREETGLEVTEILDDGGRIVWTGVRPDGTPGAAYECLRPAFVCQTLRGPFDSIGFFFRCRARGELVAQEDLASGRRWVAVTELRRVLAAAPETFNGLSQAALAFYLRECRPAPQGQAVDLHESEA